jgi:hypothetical protein
MGNTTRLNKNKKKKYSPPDYRESKRDGKRVRNFFT